MRSRDLILVVDDDPDGRDMLVEYLRFKRFNVREAGSGKAALDLASVLRPRLILMDLAMGELDGLETTRRLRANASTKNAIIVAMTGRVFATDRNEAHRAGCDGFISKPFDLTTLAGDIDRILGNASGAAAPHSPPAGRPGVPPAKAGTDRSPVAFVQADDQDDPVERIKGLLDELTRMPRKSPRHRALADALRLASSQFLARADAARGVDRNTDRKADGSD